MVTTVIRKRKKINKKKVVKVLKVRIYECEPPYGSYFEIERGKKNTDRLTQGEVIEQIIRESPKNINESEPYNYK